MKVSVKVPLIISLVAVPAATTAFLLGYNLIWNAIADPSRQGQLMNTRQTMTGIDEMIDERFKDVQTLAKSQALAKFTENPSTANAGDAKTRLDETKLENGWSYFSIVQPDGDVLVIDSTAVDQVTLDPDKLVLIKRAAGGEAVYSDVFMADNAKPTMFFAAPISDGAQSDVVVGYLDWQAVVQALEVAGDEVKVVLYNKDGVVIAANGEVGDLFAEPKQSHSLDQAKQGHEGIFLEKPGGGDEQLVTTAVEKSESDFKGNGWVLTISAPTAVLFATATNVAAGTVVILSISTIGVIAALSLLINRIFKPVIAMIDTANKMALGDLTQRVLVKQNNEIGQLGQAFNNMAEKLQLIYRDLENRVKEKTAQLAQKVAETGIEKAKDEAILASIGEGMIAVEANGTIAKINDLAIEMLEVDSKTSLGASIYKVLQFFDQKDAPVAPDYWPPVMTLKTGKKTESIFSLRKANHSKFQVAVLANPVVQDGKIIGAIVVIRDVTKEREVDRMKTEFISLASHQLRTPLSAIKWFSEMLVSGDGGKLTPTQADFAKNIYESTERMINLVNSLLNISRIESGRIIVDPQPTDLKEMVNDIVKDLKAKLDERQQTILLSVHDELGSINLDPRLISQVYLNFLTNAIKYTPKGGEIGVFISRKGEEVISQIADNGYGIPKREQGNVFKKFFRAENVVKIEADGTGLGLYLVKAIVESSGGKVWFRSIEGKGTSFWFSLPAAGMKAQAGEVTLDN